MKERAKTLERKERKKNRMRHYAGKKKEEAALL
jgi:hypothetical protein